MIDYIKYKINGQTYSLIQNPDGSWSTELNAPSVAGRYDLILEISENGSVTFIDGSDSRYEFFMDVMVSVEQLTHIEDYVPEFIAGVEDLGALYETENAEFDVVKSELSKLLADAYIQTASNDGITRRENFLRIKGQGSLEQRRSYLLSIYQKGKKLNEATIKAIAQTIAGADCIVKFFGSAEGDNPQPGYGLLRVQVLSPDNNKDYRYEDIERALTPLVPGHIKLVVIKFFATWDDVKSNFATWESVRFLSDWQALKDYIPPQ